MVIHKDTDSPTTTQKTRLKLVLLGLVSIFVGPIIIAWLYTVGYFELGSRGRTNRGILITPPINLRDAADLRPLFERAQLAPGEWLVLYLSPQACATLCEATIARLTTIRSLLGYSGQRVHILSLDPEIRAGLSSQGKIFADPTVYNSVAERLVNHTPNVDLPQILFLDWRQQLVLRFDRDATSGDIKKDLKRLLRASKIR